MCFPWGGCDAALAVQWLERLGPITWDFAKLTMEFGWEGKIVQLKGLKMKGLSFEEKTS